MVDMKVMIREVCHDFQVWLKNGQVVTHISDEDVPELLVDQTIKSVDMDHRDYNMVIELVDNDELRALREIAKLVALEWFEVRKLRDVYPLLVKLGYIVEELIPGVTIGPKKNPRPATRIKRGDMLPPRGWEDELSE